MNLKYVLVLFQLMAFSLNSSAWAVQKDRYSEATLRNDPEVLVSSSQSQSVTQPVGMVALSIVEKLDRLIKSFTYNPKSTTIAEAKTIDQIIALKSGNCFEVARLAFFELSKEGYNAHVIDLKVGNSGWHSICAFQELDGTWSYFQANYDQMGYFKVHASSIEAMLKDQFINPTDVKVVI